MTAGLLEYGPYLLTAYFAFGIGLLSPGPNILAIVGASMGVSRGTGVAIACGISTGSVIWASLAVFGLTAVLASFAWFAVTLKIVGGLYLLWLAFKYLRSAWHDNAFSAPPARVPASSFVLFCQGLTLQMTNPKAAMHWMAIAALVIRPDAPVWVAVAIVVGNGFLSFAGHIAWALSFSTTGMTRFYQSFKRRIDATIGALLSMLGFGLLFAALKRS